MKRYCDDFYVSLEYTNCRLKKQFSHDDPVTNKGLVISPRMRHGTYQNMTVKVLVVTKYCSEPIIFTCDCKSFLIQYINLAPCFMCTRDKYCFNFDIKIRRFTIWTEKGYILFLVIASRLLRTVGDAELGFGSVRISLAIQ